MFRAILVMSGLILLLAVALPHVFLALMKLNKAPPDPTIGTIPKLNDMELAKHYANKRALLIGGTRGVGYGTALAMARAGAHVTIVGRSESSGHKAVESIRDQLSADDDDGSQRNDDRVQFLQGDIGSVSSANALVEKLAAAAAASDDNDVKEDLRYDYLVVSAATFPDWSSPLQNEDGIDKSFAIAVTGRFLVYRNMHRFLVKDNTARVLNVLASGMQPIHSLDRDLVSGKKNVSSLIQAMMAFGLANELMIDRIIKESTTTSTTPIATMVSTHPGILKTELHRGQGLAFDIFEHIMVTLAGISEEECGVRQASILASDRLHKGGLSYVDEFCEGRLKSAKLQKEIDENGEWLWAFLTDLEQRGSISQHDTM